MVYRIAPPPPDEPELDRVPVLVRGGILRGGTIVVTPTTLRFEPRLGSARSAPIGKGLGALALSSWIDPDHVDVAQRDRASAVVDAWTTICASAPYERGLARAPRELLAGHIRYVDTSGEVTNDTDFVIVLEPDALVAIAATAADYDACFETAEHAWPHCSGDHLRRALRWLPAGELAAAIERVRRRVGSRSRWFDRDQVRARKIHGRWHHLGDDELDTVVLKPTRAELALLERWLG